MARMTLSRPLLIIAFACCAALGAHGEIYKHVDKDGNVSFSDQPRDGGEWVPLEPTNTVSPPQSWQRHTPRRQRPHTSQYWQVKIIEPAADTIISNGLAPTRISGQITPAMQAHQRVRLLLDGVPVAESSRPSFTVDRIARGAHTLQLELRDGDSVLGSSEPVPVFVYWPGGRG